MSFPLLTVLVVVPLVGALVTPFVPRRGGLPRYVALAFAVATLLLGVAVAVRFDPADGGLQQNETYRWIDALGVHVALGVDGLGLLMVLLTVVLVPIVLVAAWRDEDGHEDVERRAGSFFAWALALEAFSLAVFLATDVFLFYVVFEATLIPAYFLIGGFGRDGRAGAALKFLMFQLGGGLVLLGSVIGLYVVSAQQGAPSYLLSDLQQLELSTGAGRWLFAGFLIAFVVKAPLFPLHTWLADTTEKATPATSVLLVCVLDKIGTFGMLRFCLGLFPEASQWATPLVMVLALISIVYGALLAIGQDDVFRLIGLTSLSHFGFITVGVFALSSQGGSGAILYMVNHGVATAALFLAAGFLVRRRGTTLISEMGGMEKVTPMLAGLFLVAGLATLGLPGLSQFVSEMLVLIAAFDYAWYVGVVAVTGIVLAAIYVLWAYQRIMTGPGPDAVHTGTGTDADTDTGARAEVHAGAPARTGSTLATAPAPVAAGGSTAVRRPVSDLTARETWVMVPLMLALVGFGFYPQPLLDASGPTVAVLMERNGVVDDAPVVSEAEPAQVDEQGN